jgi:hypothetical protein
MSPMFDSIESAHEYVGLLLEAITESAFEIQDLSQTSGNTSPQRCEAFRLIAYKLEQLRFHIDVSHRRLNDLRTLYRMLQTGRSVTLAG